MHITQLTSENVLRLKAVHIEPQSGMVIIGGDNAQGKTSVLDSIMLALAGKDVKKHPLPLRQGAENGFTELELSNGWTVRRTYTKTGGGTLTVKAQDGGRHNQSKLKEFFSGLTFDPLQFLHMEAVKQAETLRALTGLDFSELDKERTFFFDERTAVNRELKGIESRIESMPVYKEAPVKEVSVSELLDELSKRQSINSDNELERNAVRAIESEIEATQVSIDEVKVSIEFIKEKLAKKESELASLRASAEVIRERYVSQKQKVSALKDADEQEIKDQLSKAGDINAQVRSNRTHAEACHEYEAKKAESEALTEKIKRIDEQKAEQLAAAEFPVDGLSFDETGVTYNGIPFKQASSAEAMRVSLAMGIAMNPELKVLLIRDGSLLDQSNLKMISEMAQKTGHQVFVERVGKNDEGAIIIEDGAVLDESRAAA